jgi:hypothetical protein
MARGARGDGLAFIGGGDWRFPPTYAQTYHSSCSASPGPPLRPAKTVRNFNSVAASPRTPEPLGGFAGHSADVHELVDELAAAGAREAAQKYLMPAHRAKGATKALLYASPWRMMLSVLLATPPAGLHRGARAHARRAEIL